MRFPRIRINHMVAILGLCLALSTFLVVKRFGLPDKIAIGAGFMCVLVVAMFWSTVLLTDDHEDEDD